MTPPLLSIVGKKHAGKTTLTVRLTAALRQRGWRVMIIKHGSHTFNIDPAASDTYRHYHEGGAERVVMISPDKFAMVMRWEQELTPEAVAAQYLHDADIVLCEGFKMSGLPKVEIFRRAEHDAPLYDAALPNGPAWQAMVTDAVPGDLPFPVFRLDEAGWLDQLVAWVELRFLPNRS